MSIATRIVRVLTGSDMRPGRRVFAIAAAAALALLVTAAPGFCENWPTRRVTIVVPFPPGGNTDTMARILAQKLSQKFGEPFVVENRLGASGAIGATAVARAEPDGYTLLFGAVQQISVLPYTQKVSYNPKTDFAYVSIFGEGPFVFGINSSVPVKSLREFIDYAKQNPGKMNYGSGGAFSGVHLVAALLFKKAGIKLTHVPYRGGGPAIAALLGDHVQAYFGNASELIAIDSDPRVRILATSSAKPMPQLPGVPTVNKLYPGFVFNSWNGLMAPAKTPQDIRTKLEAATIEAAHDPQVTATLAKLGIATVGSTSRQFLARLASDKPLFKQAIAAARPSAY